MSSLLTINHFINNANSFIQDVNSGSNTHYVFAARHFPWVNANGVNDDSAIGNVSTSVAQTEHDVYNEILYGKLIQSTDVSHVVPRYNWTSNTVYPAYDQNDTALYTKQFFVVTSGAGDEYNVYKCLYNNGNTASTIKPSLQITSGTFETGDGYVWKYMYTIDATSNTKFTTPNFIPVVSNTQVQSNTIPGTIDVIKIANGGTNYNVYETGQVQAIIDRNNIKISSNSSSFNNYYTNSSIYLKTGFGSGQVREISSYNGTSKVATIADPIDLYVRYDLVNTSFIAGGGAVGEKMEQVIDNIDFLYRVGYVNPNSNVVQTDTSVSAIVDSSNTSAISVSRFNKNVNFNSILPLRDTTDTGTATASIQVNTSNSSGLSVGVVLTNGTGYTSNTTVTITSATGTGGTANAQANSTGKITTINIANSGNAYATIPTVVVGAPTAQTFNANTDVTAGVGAGLNNVIALYTANVFVVGDQITYSVSSGNTAIGGLSSNTTYFVQFANATHIALCLSANTDDANRIQLTKGLTESGHILQGKTATATIYPASFIATNATATALTTSYSNNDFIRIGDNANTNIRRIMTVNATTITVNYPFSNTLTSNTTFKMNTVLEPSSITTTYANGIISNSNINSRKLTIANTSVVGASFILGERVDLLDYSNTSLNANGTVAFSNSTTIFISGVNGTWVANNRIRGASSLLTANVMSVDTNPNVTIKNPNGTFLIGRRVDFKDSTTNTGIALINDIINLSQDVVEYEIGPTIKITGDGNGAIAVASVNTSVGTGNTINKITVINAGNNYTEANVTIYANTSHGNNAVNVVNAVANAIISPLLGHGADPVHELGARYVSIDVKFDTASNESWYYPTNVTARKFGIIKNPKFANVNFTLTNFDRVRLTTNNISGWTNGEIVVQGSSNAAGVVTTSNSTTLELKNVKGAFVNTANAQSTIYGYSSAKLANVTAVSVLRFFANDVATQENGANGTIIIGANSSNTEIYMTLVSGKMANGFVISTSSNAYATINSISSSDKSKNLSTTFGKRFNQTSRITLASNTGSYIDDEYVIQTGTGARGRILSDLSDLDLVINNLTGSFTIGDNLYNLANTANAKITFANSTYLKLTNVSNTSAFTVSSNVSNGLGASANVGNVHTVIIVSDVTKTVNFSSSNSSQTIIGANSAANGVPLSVTIPDLVRETGKVLYLETSNTVVTREINSTEEIRLVLKF